MNFFKNGFLSLSLIIAGILVGTGLQADDNYISIKNNYRVSIRLVGNTSLDSIQETIKPGKTAVFEIVKSAPISFISIYGPKPTLIVDSNEISEHPNQNLKVTISSDWWGKWVIQKDWKTPLVDDFTKI